MPSPVATGSAVDARSPKRLKEVLRAFRQLNKADQTEFLRRNHEASRDLLLAPGVTGPERVRLDYDKAEIRLRRTTVPEAIRAVSCAKEPWTVAWIEEFLQPGESFYDVGANVGAYSLVAAKWTRGRARVIAIEPGYANFDALCENIYVNACVDCVTPIPVAVSSQTGLVQFRYRDLRPGAAVHQLAVSGVRDSFTTAFSQPVLTFRLDDLVSQFDLPPPVHIKIDVDGAELEVLRGARRCLADPVLRSLMVELSDAQRDSIVGELADLGLERLQTTLKENARGEAMTVSYGLFTRR